MRTLFVLLMLAAPLASAPVPKALKKPPDTQLILGRWVCRSCHLGLSEYTHPNGEVLVVAPPGEKSMTLATNRNRFPFEYSFPGGAGEIDIVCNGNPYLGRYTLEGDEFRVAIRDKIRPTAVEPQTDGFLYVYRRESADLAK